MAPAVHWLITLSCERQPGEKIIIKIGEMHSLDKLNGHFCRGGGDIFD